MSVPRPSTRVLGALCALMVTFSAGVVIGRVSHGRASPGVLDEAEARIAHDAAHSVAPQDLERAAVIGMLQALDDRWAAYYGPAQFRRFEAMLFGDYSGVGLWVRREAAGELVVVSVQPGSPAAVAGIAPGDELLSVDGDTVAGRGVADVVAALRGQPGSQVVLTVDHDGTQVSRSLRRVSLGTDNVSLSVLPGGVPMLRVAAFTAGVGRWVRSVVQREQRAGVQGMVLDLRGNPGGLLDEAVQTAGAFLPGGPVVLCDRRGQPQQVLTAAAGGDASTPLVVLVDGGTASAAEIVTGALQDRGRAVVVGSQTFGKGSIQEPTRLADGSALEFTVATYRTPSGRRIDGVGITPDVAVPASAGESVVEARALQVLSGMPTAAPARG